MKIAAVKLINGGLKGIQVKYETTKEQDGRTFITEHTDIKKTPVHQNLIENFRSLRVHMLMLMGYSESQAESLMNNSAVIISEVVSGAEDFLIKGQLELSNIAGTKHITINTPKITEDDEYEGFIEVMKIVDSIWKETKEFIDGKAKMDDKQLVMDFYSKKKGIDEETMRELDSLEGADLAKKATEILESMGAIVLLEEEMSDEPSVRDINSGTMESKEEIAEGKKAMAGF
jgi:hypothetical protein